MRVDGRKPDEMRPVVITPEFTRYAEGSVLIEIGKTIVLCNATIEEGVPRWMEKECKKGGWVTGEYALLPRATHKRTPRETFGFSGRTQEIRRLIGRSLRAAVDLEKLGNRTCILDCDVLEADGGTRTAAITGGYLALAIAMQRLIRTELLPADVLTNRVAAISTGILNGVPLLDLCYEEDSQAEVDANIVMNDTGQFIEIQTTAESGPFSRQAFDELLNLAHIGISWLIAKQSSILDEIS